MIHVNSSENITLNSTIAGVNLSPAIVGILYSFLSLTVLVNVPAAIILIEAIIRKTKVNNIHILSLGITDLIVGVLGFPIVDTNLNTKITFTDCLIRFFFFNAAYIASNAHIFGICVERICLICLKIAAMKENRKLVSVLTIIVTWVFAFIICIVDYTTRAVDRIDHTEKTCLLDRVLPGGHHLTAYILTSFQTGIITCMVILVAYLANHQRQMRLSNIRTVSKNEIRRCMTVCVIVAICTFFNIPIIVVLFYGRFGVVPSRLVRSASFMVAGFNSFINPVIYIFRIKQYRLMLVDVFRKMKCCKNKVTPFPENQQVSVFNIQVNCSQNAEQS